MPSNRSRRPREHLAFLLGLRPGPTAPLRTCSRRRPTAMGDSSAMTPRRACVAFVAFAVAFFSSAATGGTPPPGATTQCQDGTYSYSQTHSGTCSHHGGVAAWLTPSTSTPTTTTVVAPVTTAPPTTTNATTTPAIGSIDVGKTVLLMPRTRTSGCTLGANPDRRCSPGAYYSKLTKAVICSSTFRTGPIRNVPDSEKHAGRGRVRARTEALRHDAGDRPHRLARARRLQRHRQPLPGEGDARGAPGYHVKDKLENKLHDLVCDGAMTLRSVSGRSRRTGRRSTSASTASLQPGSERPCASALCGIRQELVLGVQRTACLSEDIERARRRLRC